MDLLAKTLGHHAGIEPTPEHAPAVPRHVGQVELARRNAGMVELEAVEDDLESVAEVMDLLKSFWMLMIHEKIV